MTNIASFLQQMPRMMWGIRVGDRRMMVSSGKFAWAEKGHARSALLNHMWHATGGRVDSRQLVGESLEKGYVNIIPLHRVILNVGDWGGDGHGVSYDVPILCNRTGRDIETAYREAVEMVGFDLIDQCADYGSRTMTDEQVQLLTEAGLDPIKEIQDYEDYLILYLEFVMLADPDFEYEYVRDDHLPIGGYGVLG